MYRLGLPPCLHFRMRSVLRHGDGDGNGDRQSMHGQFQFQLKRFHCQLATTKAAAAEMLTMMRVRFPIVLPLAEPEQGPYFCAAAAASNTRICRGVFGPGCGREL